MCDILALRLYYCYSLALPVCALWQLVCWCVSGLRFAPVLRGIKRHFYTIRTSVVVYEPLYVLSVKWTSTPCENQRVWIWGNDCVCVCLSMCVCERKRNRQPVFSRAGSETAGRDNNRSCYILVVSLISAWGRGLALALALALDLDLAFGSGSCPGSGPGPDPGSGSGSCSCPYFGFGSGLGSCFVPGPWFWPLLTHGCTVQYYREEQWMAFLREIGTVI